MGNVDKPLSHTVPRLNQATRETSTDLDWIEWYNFQTLLSVERTEPFLRELVLPLEPEEFPRVMRLARACLEVRIAPPAASAELDPEFRGLPKIWTLYRQQDPVLGFEELRQFVSRRFRPEEEGLAVWAELQDWIGTDLAAALQNWFLENFRSTVDPIWQWPWALRLLIVDDPSGVPSGGPSLTKEQRQLVNSFNIRYGFMERQLAARFEVIRYAATGSISSLWERVLQEYGGGMGNHHPWLGTVRSCLDYRLIRREWARLQSELGPVVMDDLVAWVRQHENLLPNETALPGLPAPLPD